MPCANSMCLTTPACWLARADLSFHDPSFSSPLRAALPASQADNISTGGGQKLGIKESTTAFGCAASCTMIMGYFDWRKENPAASRPPVRHEVVTYVLGTICYRCLGLDKFGIGGRGGIRNHGTLAGTPVFKTGALNHSAHPSD